MRIDPTEINPSKLRKLASWYRDFAERAGNPATWVARLRTAEELEAEADLAGRTRASCNPGHAGQADGKAG
jgi:hypothetical protein